MPSSTSEDVVSGVALTQGRDGARGLLPGAPAIERLMRRSLLRRLTGEREIRLTRLVPSPGELRRKFEEIDALGLYVHIPFCEQICPYCPYNKELYRSDLAEGYVRALKREIDLYSDIVADRPITSFYIGGGTPTTMLAQRSGGDHRARASDVRSSLRHPHGKPSQPPERRQSERDRVAGSPASEHRGGGAGGPASEDAASAVYRKRGQGGRCAGGLPRVSSA